MSSIPSGDHVLGLRAAVTEAPGLDLYTFRMNGCSLLPCSLSLACLHMAFSTGPFFLLSKANIPGLLWLLTLQDSFLLHQSYLH